MIFCTNEQRSIVWLDRFDVTPFSIQFDLIESKSQVLHTKWNQQIEKFSISLIEMG